MKKVVIGLLLATAVTAYADWYKVTVTRKGQDLYRVDGTSVYIVTRYCYEYAYSEEAVLKYKQYSYDNKLVFDSGTTCDVEKLVN